MTDGPLALRRPVPNHSDVYQTSLDRLSLDGDLSVARRRADSCMHGSPSWDAAMGLVEELEDAMRKIESTPDAPDERQLLRHPCN
jgi:hypothetical protein